jgi:HSP20 family protein
MRYNSDNRPFGALDDLWTRFGMGDFGAESNVSIEREDDGYVVLADLPGFGKEDLDIRFEDGHLTITGTHETEAGDEGRRTARSRRVHERVHVPGNVRIEDIAASLKNGVLEVRLPVEGEDGDGGHRIDVL